MNKILEKCKILFEELETVSLKDKIKLINSIRMELHKYSPFKSEPIDCVQWLPVETVVANDYNPNSVAPPEMKLLELSIQEDGYTQPVVTWERDGINEVVDGFHRTRVAKESKEINKRVLGHLPAVVINTHRTEISDRMAATIRHNRARGKHNVDSMADIVMELKRRNRSEEWIAKNLGMDSDEVLRLCQITGMAELFANDDFSKSWEAGMEGIDEEIDFEDKDNAEE